MARVCATCHDPLLVTVDASDDEENPASRVGEGSSTSRPGTIPDDVHLLSCNCHFHWLQCLLDAYQLTSCPSCSTELITESEYTREQQILCDLNNEGGLQQSYNILPILTEESYLKAFPEERRARAFLEFCRTGDVPAIVELLKGGDNESDEDSDDELDGNQMEEDTDMASEDRVSPIDVLRYQDPIGEKKSGLHYAVAAGNREVVWLLLLLASRLDLQEFPAIVFQEAASMGIMRDEVDDGAIDIRSLRDANDRSAEDYAVAMVNPWRDWIGKNYLAI